MENKTSPYILNGTEMVEKNKKTETPDILIKTKDVTEDIVYDIEKFYTGWKNFAFKDRIIDVAVGMIVGTSFKNTVNSMVVDIIMPLLLGFGVGTNVQDLFIVLVDGETKLKNTSYITLEEAKEDGAVTLNYGSFINIFFDLIFVTLCLYITLKLIYRCKKKMKTTKKTIKDLL